MTITLNPVALGHILKGAEIRAAVNEVAEKIASAVDDQNITVGAFRGGQGEIALPVQVRKETTDRAKASVVLAHPAGIAVQAKYGALTRAASSVGFQVHGD